MPEYLVRLTCPVTDTLETFIKVEAASETEAIGLALSRQHDVNWEAHACGAILPENIVVDSVTMLKPTTVVKGATHSHE